MLSRRNGSRISAMFEATVPLPPTIFSQEIGAKVGCDKLSVLKQVDIEHAVEKAPDAIQDVAKIDVEEGVRRSSHGDGSQGRGENLSTHDCKKG